ncbi:asparaginase [Blastococcus sp. CT_GayMR20]|uniref:asparaginase n=1 Tax=Blastococcus sp. CT_GayMR20 TaxID=2559609 RepID=UPI001073B082|nr:asparaginase [Blastococcus sp. CT_GayMR20]TFV82736.1 asparaginase [Blastococcus sp. CT_GayMR20]TFV82747.1 asparaginase [Blastococcus sp. CT_GayMR20]
MTGDWPDNPVLVEVWRSGFLESAHRGSLVVLDADGAVTFAAGAVDRPVLPRSSNKPVQATALLAAGWSPRSAQELAIGAGSHNGEDRHRQVAAGMLTAVGLGPDDLGCPPALPQHIGTESEWIVAGRAPERLAMNCSGKHAAMLSACVAAGWPTSGYLERDHPLQQAIEARLAEAAEEPVTAVVVDGCGAPQHALSVTGLARGVLSLVEAQEGSPERSVADAMRAHPWFVAGTGHEDTGLMTAVPGLLAKCGADGVHVAALPGRGAVALKVDDGGDRGRTPALCAGLLRLGMPEDVLAPWLRTPVSGGEGVVGEVCPAPLLRG